MIDPFGMEDALAAVEAENPLKYSYGGTEYPCSLGDKTSLKELAFGGYTPQADMVLVCRKSTFGTAAPTLKGEITVGATVYLLDQIVEDPNGIFQVWSLSDPNKSA
jgi:hypothetical protein